MTTATLQQPDLRPVSAFASQREFINAVFVELNRRLAPARLANSNVNGSILSANQNVAGSNPQNVGEFADRLERAVKDIVYDRKLIWEIEPKTLKGPTPEKQLTAAEAEERMGKWKKDAEAKAAYDKEQVAAEKRIAGLIAAFAPARNNRLDHTVQEKANAKHRGWFNDAKKSGKDLRTVEADIRADQATIYDEIERSSWKM